MPIVSVIVPFFDVGQLLEECLTSIARQTLTDFECILVDDGSSDQSAVIARRWATKDPRFTVLTQNNRGPGPARNFGIAHATAPYLMFVDGDDLLAPRALEQLHTSLEQSGSDLAGAQVWRLPLTRPVELSWAHTEPFAERRQRTSIHEIPLLMRDRMVWNKMWRRSFWDEQGYEWPDMLFEDFPVILAAHLDAAAVDTLPDPVYVWRERPKGESISVRGVMVENVRDRVTAAKMVVDIVDAKGSPELRELVHSHLVDVDLREVMGSMLTVNESDRPAVEALAHRLGQDLDPAQVGLAQPDLQLAYRAARDNDMALLRELARQRAQTPMPDKITRVRRAPAALAHRARKLAPALSPHRTRTGKLVDYRLSADVVTYRVEIPLDHRVKNHATVKGTLGESLLATNAVVTDRGVLCDFSADTLTVARHGGFQPLEFDVRSLVGIHFTGHVIADAGDLHGFHRAGYWLQAVNRSGRFGLERNRDAQRLEVVGFDKSELVLHVSTAAGTLLLEQPWPRQAVEVPIVHHEARLGLEQVISADPADNPVTDVASRRFQLRTADGTHNLRLVGPGLRQPISGRDVEIKRSDDGSAFLVHRPL